MGVQGRVEASQVFPEHAHGPRHVSHSPGFQEFFRALLKRLIPQPLLPSLLVSLLFASTQSSSLVSANIFM